MFCIPLYLPYRFFLSFSMALCAKVLQFLTKLRFAPRKFLSLLSHFGAGLSIICFYVRVWHNGKARRCGRKPAMPGFAIFSIRYSRRVKAPLEGSWPRKRAEGWLGGCSRSQGHPSPAWRRELPSRGALLLYKLEFVT